MFKQFNGISDAQITLILMLNIDVCIYIYNQRETGQLDSRGPLKRDTS